MFVLRIFAASLLLIVSSASVVLGLANGKVSGTVTDPNGAAVPGAVIKLQNKATTIEVSTTTNESGYFNFANLNPATYACTCAVTPT